MSIDFLNLLSIICTIFAYAIKIALILSSLSMAKKDISEKKKNSTRNSQHLRYVAFSQFSIYFNKRRYTVAVSPLYAPIHLPTNFISISAFHYCRRIEPYVKSYYCYLKVSHSEIPLEFDYYYLSMHAQMSH